MTNTEKLPDTMFTLSKSTPDSNRFYSILLDTRASTMSENMYDIAEKLLQGEKDNAKNALEHLWSLKKNMQNQDEVNTIDLLIQYYQNKIDVLRNKEEHIKKVSRDSRGLLEDKRKRDAEVATIKQEIADCTNGIRELDAKLEKLKIKEQELTLIEGQLQKELVVNENEIINGLYEIIIINSGEEPSEVGFSDKLRSEAAISPSPAPAGEGPIEAPQAMMENKLVGDETAEIPFSIPLQNETDQPDVIDELAGSHVEINKKDETELVIYKQPEPEAPPLYPKSVVKTTRGRVVGEYYYDAKVYKNKRHYIFNSKFFLEQLSQGVLVLKTGGSEPVYTELLQMIQDAHKRISENPSMHFEIATNEILNDKTIKELWHNVKTKNMNDAVRFCKRLNAKITALGANYRAILKEQMERYIES
jgi:P2-related tail formation protein